jgi:hypothetical protein
MFLFFDGKLGLIATGGDGPEAYPADGFVVTIFEPVRESFGGLVGEAMRVGWAIRSHN